MSKRLACTAALAMVWLLAAADTGQLKDPMRPFSPGAAQRPVEQRFELTATLVSDERRVAIINGRTVRVGEAVNGAEVKSIDPSSVELSVGSRTVRVSLGRRTTREAEVEGDPTS